MSEEFFLVWKDTLQNILALGEEHDPAVFTQTDPEPSALSNYCGAAAFILANAMPAAKAGAPGEAALMLAGLTHAVTDRVLRETEVPAPDDAVNKRLRWFHKQLNKAAAKVLKENDCEVYTNL